MLTPWRISSRANATFSFAAAAVSLDWESWKATSSEASEEATTSEPDSDVEWLWTDG